MLSQLVLRKPHWLSFCKRAASPPLSPRAVNKAARLTAHLLSLLRMVYRIRYLTGRELTGSGVRSAILPFLENLRPNREKEALVALLVSFPEAPKKTERLYHFGDSFTSPVLGEVKFGAFPQLQAHMVHGKLPLSVVHLLELGFPPDEVVEAVSAFPSLATHSVERSVKPMIEFLLELAIHRRRAEDRPQAAAAGTGRSWTAVLERVAHGAGSLVIKSYCAIHPSPTSGKSKRGGYPVKAALTDLAHIASLDRSASTPLLSIAGSLIALLHHSLLVLHGSASAARPAQL